MTRPLAFLALAALLAVALLAAYQAGAESMRPIAGAAPALAPTIAPHVRERWA